MQQLTIPAEELIPGDTILDGPGATRRAWPVLDVDVIGKDVHVTIEQPSGNRSEVIWNTGFQLTIRRHVVPMQPVKLPLLRPSKAHQHLNRDGVRQTLCGFGFDDIYEPKVFDLTVGFDPLGGPGCRDCVETIDPA